LFSPALIKPALITKPKTRNPGNHDMNEKLKNYIAARQLHYLWNFQGESYFEDQLGKIISLTQIEREIS
tara:strand:- start:841 stop:1047 length:207 start_codon:yes stop_codon:yes gene_type:complete